MPEGTPKPDELSTGMVYEMLVVWHLLGQPGYRLESKEGANRIIRAAYDLNDAATSFIARAIRVLSQARMVQYKKGHGYTNRTMAVWLVNGDKFPKPPYNAAELKSWVPEDHFV